MTKRTLKLIVIVVLTVLAVVIVLQNTESVETRVLFFSFQLPRAVLLAATLALGFIVGVLVQLRTLARKPSDTREREQSD